MLHRYRLSDVPLVALLVLVGIACLPIAVYRRIVGGDDPEHGRTTP